jgi:geranylgeranyl reductase family protein
MRSRLDTPEHIEQKPAQELTRKDWSAIVIGAGPAGSVAAATLAGYGHQTLLLDKHAFPRTKVCGDGLNHDSQRFLRTIKLLEKVKARGHSVEYAKVYSTGGIELVIPGPYITLERRILDTILANHAVHSGAKFCSGKVEKVSQHGPELQAVHVSGLHPPLQSRFVVLATGASVKIARSLQIVHRARPSALAARCYVVSREKLDCLASAYVQSVLPGYGWVFPMGDGLYNMGVIAYDTKGKKKGVGLKKRFEDFVRDFPLAHKVYRRGHTVSELKAAPLRCGLPASIVPGRGNLLATGETIGTTFHCTGEGIGKAMETGQLAAEVIHEALSGRASNVVRRFSECLNNTCRPKYPGYAVAEKWLRHPWINDFMARRGVRSRFLQKAVTEAVTQEADPKEAFSLKGLFRSMLS